MRHRKGWRSAEQRRGRPVAVLPDAPTEFDALLSSMGLTEAEAVGNAVMRAWVKQHRQNKFVPEAVVEAICGRQD